MTWATAALLATLQVWLISDHTKGAAYGLVVEAPKCCSSLTAIDTLLGMMQEYKDEMKTLKVQVQSGGQNHDTLTAKVAQLEKKLGAQPVAFLAELSKHLENPAKGVTVVFDVTHLNDGNAYNKTNGIFTAPAAGVYHFTLELSSADKATNRDYLHVKLMKMNTIIGYVYLDWNPDRWLKRSATATVHLAKGDTIFAQVTRRTGNGIISGCCYHSVFSGFLINAD